MTTGPFWGTDKRVFPALTAWLQNLATFRSNVPPPYFTLEFLGFRLGIPWTGGRVLLFRVHLWRYDYYAKAYIFFSAMSKRVNPTDVSP